jgi:hypothetical protein
MSPEYLAGFFDGEGCIQIIQGHCLTVRADVCQTELSILEEIQCNFGGNLRHLRRRTPKQSESWRLTWEAKSAIEILEKILPYLRVKRPQAEIVLNEWKPLVQTRGKGISRGPKALSLENIAKRLEIRKRISNLNSRIN